MALKKKEAKEAYGLAWSLQCDTSKPGTFALSCVFVLFNTG